MIKQEIRALFLAHGFEMEQQPDGSTDLDPACYSVAQALAEQVALLSHSLSRVWVLDSLQQATF